MVVRDRIADSDMDDRQGSVMHGNDLLEPKLSHVWPPRISSPLSSSHGSVMEKNQDLQPKYFKSQKSIVLFN